MGSRTPPGYNKVWTCIWTEGEAMWETGRLREMGTADPKRGLSLLLPVYLYLSSLKHTHTHSNIPNMGMILAM